MRNPDTEDEGPALPVALVGLKNLGAIRFESIAMASGVGTLSRYLASCGLLRQSTRSACVLLGI